MKIIHKDSKRVDNRHYSVSLDHWQTEYRKNKKYLNYIFYDVPEICDLFEINEETGESNIYVKTDFKKQLERIVDENPFKYVIKKLADGRLDQYLMPVGKTSHLGDLKESSKPVIINPKPTPKTQDERSIGNVKNKTPTNASTLIIGVIICFIGVILNTEKLSVWFNSIINDLFDF